MKYYVVPGELSARSNKPGKVEALVYETKAYENDERKLTKKAYVYLPYDYDESKTYPLMILVHGGGGNETEWLLDHGDNKIMLDNMMAKGISEEAIIVTPTFYPRDKAMTYLEGRYLPAAFHHEVRNDLLPAIEKKYSVSKDRENRAFAGLSMGSMTTYWSGISHMMDLFSWFGPYSGCAGPDSIAEENAQKILDAIDVKFKDYSINYMFCCNGTKDIAHDEHVDTMKIVADKSAKLTEGVNYEFIDVPNAEHNWEAWHFALYHTMTKFFKK